MEQNEGISEGINEGVSEGINEGINEAKKIQSPKVASNPQSHYTISFAT
jgi:hypothetical protein